MFALEALQGLLQRAFSGAGFAAQRDMPTSNSRLKQSITKVSVAQPSRPAHARPTSPTTQAVGTSQISIFKQLEYLELRCGQSAPQRLSHKTDSVVVKYGKTDTSDK